jgi:cyclophilin family peptidyl-prolyl cis-trans isomerase
MMDRAWGGAFRRSRSLDSRKPSRVSHRPLVESLEGRQLLAAALNSISPVSVPASMGYQVPLDGSASGATSQTFSVTSSNPDIKVSVAQGPFMTINITHTPASGQPTDPTINGSITYQLFSDLTPKTTALFQEFVNSNFYTGKLIHRIADFSGTGAAAGFVYQGGSPNGDGTGNSGLPGTPYGLELNQQLAFLEQGSLAVAHSAAPNSNDTQFFWNNGPETSLDYQYTNFGQQVSGLTVNAQLNQVATTTNAGLGEKSMPITPVTITSASISNTNPNGVLHVDALGANPGETSTVQVTATDPSTHTTAVQTFTVTVVANTTPFVPATVPVTQAVDNNAPTTVQLHQTTATLPSVPTTTTFALVSQPAHGTLSQFNAATGTVVYTPTAGFSGTDTFTYNASSTGAPLSPIIGNTSTVTLNVVPVLPINTNAVRVIGTVLVVTPPATTLKATNNITLSEVTNAQTPANDKLVVTLNGNTDLIQPLVSAISRVVIFGSKTTDHIVVDPAVDPALLVTLDGGHGHGKNTLQAGAGTTVEHGWFGQNLLDGGSGPNKLIGRKGHVHFVPTKTTTQIFAGVPHPGKAGHQQAPGGTFYRFVNGKLVPIPTPQVAHHSTKKKA